MKAILEKACESLEHFPSVSQINDIASQLGFSEKSNWKYFEIADCMRCGGAGWFWIKGAGHREATRACDDCRAGKNIQMAPKGIITETKIPDGWVYDRPAKSNARCELHPLLKERFGSWEGLELAIKERRLAQTGILSDAISKLANSKSVRAFLGENYDRS